MFDTLKKAFIGNTDLKSMNKPTATVQDVHDEFDNAQEDLLEQAKAVLEEEQTTEEQELLKLKMLGFYNLPGTKEASKKQAEKRESKETLKLVAYYKENYPNYRFITEGKIKAICKKYGLIFGDVRHYVGTIPAKNRKEIIDFDKFCNLKEEDYRYCRRSTFSGEIIPIKYSLYEAMVKYDPTNLTTDKTMRIVAPLSEFNLEDKEIVDYEVRLIDKDPIVLMPCNGGYLIVSKWGNESDIV